MAPLTELEVRSAVHAALRRTESDLIVDEFVIGEQGRIDVAVVSDHLTGYEIKSDLDRLTRLPRQMAVFGEVFDYCILVVTPRHLHGARQVLKRGWGLAVVDRSQEYGLTYTQIRKPHERRNRDKLALASLLWRSELLSALDSLDASHGCRGRTRGELAARLALLTERDQLRAIVTSTLTARQGWRVATRPSEDAETSPRGGASSRFLARRFLKQRR